MVRRRRASRRKAPRQFGINVIETGAGFHIVMVDSRVRTKLEDVKALLVEQILAAPPSMHEKSSYLQALQSKAKIQMW